MYICMFYRPTDVYVPIYIYTCIYIYRERESVASRITNILVLHSCWINFIHTASIANSPILFVGFELNVVCIIVAPS